MADFIVEIPKIDSASFSANPTYINNSIILTVAVSTETKILEPTYFYSDEVYAGEV